MSHITPPFQAGKSSWMRIPDGTMVQHRYEGHQGVVDGLTEIVTGSGRNPDGRTQYRLNTGLPRRQLVTEDELCILLDGDNLVIMKHAKEPYRRSITELLRNVFADDRFVKRSLSFSRPNRKVPHD